MNNEIIQKIKNEYFEYQGQRYYAGTMFTMKKRTGNDRGKIVTAEFRGYVNNNSEKLYVFYKTKKNKYIAETYEGIIINTNEISDYIIDIIFGNYYVELNARKRYCKDSDVPELYIGWALYVFLMCLAMLFYNTFGAWILITVVFFVWRHNFKEKECYYYE